MSWILLMYDQIGKYLECKQNLFQAKNPLTLGQLNRKLKTTC